MNELDRTLYCTEPGCRGVLLVRNPKTFDDVPSECWKCGVKFDREDIAKVWMVERGPTEKGPDQ